MKSETKEAVSFPIGARRRECGGAGADQLLMRVVPSGVLVR